MKSLITLSILCCFFTVNVQSQSNEILSSILSAKNESPTDQNYFYYFNNDLKDIRDNSVVIKDVGHGQEKILEDGGYVIRSRNYNYNFMLSYYSSKNVLVGKVTDIGHLSPNWKYVITVKDGDLWYHDINIKSGKKSLGRKLTELGVFNNQFKYMFWYEDKIGLDPMVSGGSYILNVMTGEITETPTEMYIPRKRDILSPSGRYLIIPSSSGSAKGDMFYDIESNEICHELIYALSETKEGYRREHFLFWSSDDVYVSSIREGGIGSEMIKLKFTNVENSQTHEVVLYNPEESIHYKKTGQQPNASVGFPTNLFPRGYRDKFSKLNGLFMPENFNQKYILYTQHFRELDKKIFSWQDRNQLSVVMLNLFNGNKTILHQKESEMVGFDRILYRTWITPTKLVYTTQGDIIKQGTWLLDVETNKKEKITPFAATSFWNFKNTKYFMFIANNKLYRCNKDGSDLKIIEDTLNGNTEISLFKGNSYFDKTR